jgi:hypothetical protein
MNDPPARPSAAGRDPAPHAGRRAVRAAAQIIGFALGLGLMGWVISIALSAKNRAQLSHLGDARWQDVALLAGLSLLTMFNNGALFWLAVHPVRRLPLADVVAVNAVAGALSYLPFKLSLLFRFLVHNRRDGMPVLTIGAWLASFAVVLLCVVAPVAGASVWRREAGLDVLWWGAVIGGVVLMAGGVVGMAWLVRTEAAWGRFARLVTLPDGRGRGVVGRLMVRFGVIDRIHEGVRMLAHPVTVGVATLLRGFDIAVLAARFAVAARITGQELRIDQAVLVASTYFFIGVFAPTGQMGFREIGVVAMRDEAFAVVVLTVTAAEMVATVCGALVGAAWLRVDRLLARPSAPVGPA